MAEIFPQGQIVIMRDVPLSPDYNNTFWFATEVYQHEHFLTSPNYTRYQFSRQYYQRKNRGWLRVQSPYRRIFNCNYMMWKNPFALNENGSVARSMYEDKWWYAFIDNVRYINDNVTEIHYTLDVIQSYMFDIRYEDTYIERETVDDDTLWLHKIDEDLSVGEYVYGTALKMRFREQNTQGNYLSLDEGMRPFIAATCNIDYHDTTDNISVTRQQTGNGAVTGCLMLDPTFEINTSSQTKTKDWLNNLPGSKQNAILGITMVPQVIADISNSPISRILISEPYPVPTTLDGYTPFNKKLLTAPFNSLVVISSDGTSQTYAWEMFDYLSSDYSDLKFRLDTFFTFPLQGILYPELAYKNAQFRPTTMIPLPTLPSCTWSNDTWKAWAAMNTGYTALSIAGSVTDIALRVGSAAASAYTAGSSNVLTQGVGKIADVEPALTPYGTAAAGDIPITISENTPASLNGGAMANGLAKSVSPILNDVQNITRNLINVHNAKIVPDSFNGSASNLAATVNHVYGFYIGQRCIRRDYAEIIDNYFTMYGYKVLRLRKGFNHEYLKLRSRFTYIKTINIDIHGSIPSDDKDTICRIFNNGIRFWVDYNNVGNYDMTTKPNNPY